MALDARGMGAQTVERAGGMSRGSVNNLVSGHRTKPQPETLDKIAKVLRVSYQWLATGEGLMDPAEERVLDEYPGRADLRRSDWWRTLPDDLRAAVLRATPSDPEMPLDGWIDLVRYLRTFGGAQQEPELDAVSRSSVPSPSPQPRRVRR